MKSHLARLAAVVALLAAVAACSRSAKHAEDSNDLNAVTHVRVENQAFLDMNIYVISTSGSRQRLGMVTGNSTATFVIPEYVLGPANSVRFLVEPIGASRAPISDALPVQPGQTVTLTIPPNG